MQHGFILYARVLQVNFLVVVERTMGEIKGELLNLSITNIGVKRFGCSGTFFTDNIQLLMVIPCASLCAMTFVIQYIHDMHIQINQYFSYQILCYSENDTL